MRKERRAREKGMCELCGRPLGEKKKRSGRGWERLAAYVALQALRNLRSHRVDGRALSRDREHRRRPHAGRVEVDELAVAASHLEKGADLLEDLRAPLRCTAV